MESIKESDIKFINLAKNVDAPTTAPRLHPKKRKFDPAELERPENSTSSSTSTSSNVSSSNSKQTVVSVGMNIGTIIAVNPITPQIVLANIKSDDTINSSVATTSVQDSLSGKGSSTITKDKLLSTKKIVCSLKQGDSDSSNKKDEQIVFRQQPELSKTIRIVDTTRSALDITTNETDFIDLSEWCDYRVLAKRNDYYASGIIKVVQRPDTLVVEFDHPEGCKLVYQDLFNTGKHLIISDASPSISDVCISSFFKCIFLQLYF